MRKELEREGHVFRSSSDTEVILRAYRAWGADCVASPSNETEAGRRILAEMFKTCLNLFQSRNQHFRFMLFNDVHIIAAGF